MLTRLLHASGIYVGSKEALILPPAAIPDGFWKHLGFFALNDELSNPLGGAWDLPPKAGGRFMGSAFDQLLLKAQLLTEDFDSAHLWGSKDPRNSSTLTF